MRSETLQKPSLEIIAGPCSVDSENVAEIHRLAEIDTAQGPAIYGARVVGLKSRTEIIELDDSENNGMGIDFAGALELRRNPQANVTLPSVEIAEEIARKTGMLVSSEIMVPSIQMPQYIGKIPDNQGMFWTPSVNALGWAPWEIAPFAADNGWDIGIKNAKFLGISYAEALDPDHQKSQLEKTWAGQATYAKLDGVSNEEIVFIHRGVDVTKEEKGDYRNALVHEIAGRVKDKFPNSRLYLDPTHSMGPKLRDRIVDQTLGMMELRRNGKPLYDGVIFEAGTSKTDTEEHITLNELAGFAAEVAKFRTLRQPPKRGDLFVRRT